jgi:hypothetical protein
LTFSLHDDRGSQHLAGKLPGGGLLPHQQVAHL